MSYINEDNVLEKYSLTKNEYCLNDDSYEGIGLNVKKSVNETIKSYQCDLELQRQRNQKRRKKEALFESPVQKLVKIFF